jgi:hypothetical protein
MSSLETAYNLFLEPIDVSKPYLVGEVELHSAEESPEISGSRARDEIVEMKSRANLMGRRSG